MTPGEGDKKPIANGSRAASTATAPRPNGSKATVAPAAISRGAELVERLRSLGDDGASVRAALARHQAEQEKEIERLERRRDEAERELLERFSSEELRTRLAALEAEIGRLDGALAAREHELLEELARVRAARERVKAALTPGGPAANAGPDGTAADAAGAPPAATREVKTAPAHTPAPGDALGERDGDAAPVIVAGDRGDAVRRSKVAIARFLRDRRPEENRALRHALFSEARAGAQADLASPRWEEGVRKAQELAGLPVTGRVDPALHALLLPFWKADSPPRTVLRKTPLWRAIPGQISPNFNLREFACRDGTPYVEGLMREKGLSKKDARARAKKLAGYLEEVRRKEGGRPLRLTSVFRTESHNARTPGAVPGSAHTRGVAVDVPVPPGVSLARHADHMRAAFPCGIGVYRGMNFVHGDFDETLGRRSWPG